MLPTGPTAVIATSDPHGKLVGVHPDLVDTVQRILIAMAVLGWPMVVTDGVRTVEQQQAAYAQGRTAPGAIVTELDGIVKRSKHQVHDDGFGHAVDCAFLVHGEPSWDGHLPWQIYGAIAMRLGLHWGGTWSHPRDLPHVELP